MYLHILNLIIATFTIQTDRVIRLGREYQVCHGNATSIGKDFYRAFVYKNLHRQVGSDYQRLAYITNDY